MDDERHRSGRGGTGDRRRVTGHVAVGSLGGLRGLAADPDPARRVGGEDRCEPALGKLRKGRGVYLLPGGRGIGRALVQDRPAAAGEHRLGLAPAIRGQGGGGGGALGFGEAVVDGDGVGAATGPGASRREGLDGGDQATDLPVALASGTGRPARVVQLPAAVDGVEPHHPARPTDQDRVSERTPWPFAL